jgi:hypothetical protein
MEPKLCIPCQVTDPLYRDGLVMDGERWVRIAVTTLERGRRRFHAPTPDNPHATEVRVTAHARKQVAYAVDQARRCFVLAGDGEALSLIEQVTQS